MNDRQFKQRIAAIVERQRREAEVQQAAPKKPPAAEKPRKAKRTRSA